MSLSEIIFIMKEPFLLYDFAPFISVAMAVNFVSSFWDAVKNKAINNLEKNKELFVSELNAVYTSGNCNNSNSVVLFTKEADKYKKNLTILSHFGTGTGMIIVVLLFILLSLIGFSPKAELTLVQCVYLVFISILPSSLFRILGLLYSNYAVKSLGDFSQIIKNTAKDAIKDTQAAYAKRPKNT